MPIELERTYRFSASHLYARPEWVEEENLARFGRCSWAPGHGHNYRLTLWIEGTIDPLTGFVIDLPALDELVRIHVLERLDHRHINAAVGEFAPGGAIPTSESLAGWIAARIVAELPRGNALRRLRLAEDDDLASVWTAD
jgi:6-pyruvoyltetrahydropterin/6-carboxytetrahydropterin synthase